MLVSSQKLNPKIFDADVEQLPLRNGFGEGLVIAADADPRVVGLCADLTDSTKMAAFAKKYPARFVEMGVAEQNLASVASGLAAVGKVPFITSYAMFSPGRNWEQIRTTICYNKRKVVIVGSHAGVSVGPDGGTHQAIEDVAIMRVIPTMVVISPVDSIEARKATVAAAKIDAPVYIRLAREKTPIVTTEESPFEIGRANILRDADAPKIALMACGPLVHRALVVAERLATQGIEAIVVNNHTIKPLDHETLTAVAKKAGRVLTIEEHQVAGGMGSAIAELLVRTAPVPMEFVGVQDLFGQSGTPDELLEQYGMGHGAIEKAAHALLAR